MFNSNSEHGDLLNKLNDLITGLLRIPGHRGHPFRLIVDSDSD